MIVVLFLEIKDAKKIEDYLKDKFKKHRIKNFNDNLSEWLKIEINLVLSEIFQVIMKESISDSNSNNNSNSKSDNNNSNSYSNYKNGETLLHIAVYEDNIEAVKSLIRCGANVNSQNAIGWSSLHSAACKGNLEVVKLLIDHGADIYIEDNDGDNPIELIEAIGDDSDNDITDKMIEVHHYLAEHM